jgi:hypothetical protein
MNRYTTYALVGLLGVGLLALAPSALAVDGVVLISQNTSVAGIEGCPHAGFPIIICRSGSYRLSGNLTIPNANTDGIDITADNVTLDLNGFTISGPVTCKFGTYPVQCSASGSGLGINTPSANNDITVHNGTVRGMGGGGINLGGDAEVVEAVHVEQNAGALGYGISLGYSGIVTRCTVRANAGGGIVGIAAIISLNVVSYNGGDGIDRGGVVRDNNVLFNGQTGIVNAGLAIHNTVVGNIGYGINSGFYQGNVVTANGLGDVVNGTSLGGNFCGTGIC